MNRVVYITEHDPDDEQALRLHNIGKECNAAGNELTVIVRDLLAASAPMVNVRATMLQAPVFLPRRRLNRQLISLADTLQLAGYEHSSTLLALVKAWQALLGLLQPDVIIFDHAPTALLAASGLKCRKLIVGNAYNIPVPGHPLADWRPLQSRAELIQEQEHNVLKVINQVQRKLELPVSATLSELYRCDRVIIDSFPQLDVYRMLRRNVNYYATVAAFLPPVFSFRRTDKQHVVCHIAPAYRKFTPLMEALRASGSEVLFIFPGGDPERLKPYESDALQITTIAPDLNLLIKEADMYIGHGNVGSITACMRLGKPMLILPMQLEQLHIGLTLQALGLAKVVADQDSASEYQKALTGVLGNLKLRTATRNFTRTNAIYAQSTFGKGVVAAFDDSTDNKELKNG